MVFQWHIAGMYAPGFFTGSLIRRFGVLRSSGGHRADGRAAPVALNGITVPHFIVALILLGVGWNFMYTGGTALLTESYAPAEKARTQGANDFIVFATMGISSFPRALHGVRAGWETMNLGALPMLAAIAAVVLLVSRRRRRAAA